MAVAISARDLTRWSFVAGMALLSAESFLVGLSWDAILPEKVARWQQWRIVLLSLIPGSWLLFSISYARGNGKAEVSRTRWLWGAALALPAAFVLVGRAHLISAVGQIDVGGIWFIKIGTCGVLLNLWVLVGSILVLMNLERTYRAAVGTMRWRIKFMIIGLGVLFVVRSYTASQVLLFKSISLSLQTLNAAGLLIACLLVARTLLRTGHFEIGVYASQALLHSSFTILFAGIYLVLLGIAAKLTADLGGDSAFQAKAFLVLVSLVLLSVVLLSDRVRLLSRRFISRHFQRPLYDYRAIWRSFTDRTNRCFHQEALCKSVAAFISEELHALSVSVWVIDEQRACLTLKASTSIAGPRAEQVGIQGPEAGELIRGLSKSSEPLEIDDSKESWIEPLRQAHPAQFPRAGGIRVCVPLLGGGEVLGCVLVADRVAGISYSVQDMELLKAIGDQAGASLLNIQLSEKLSQSKQLEAFQAMSAFFVHDLKNTASTLALMLKNFPQHYDNPDFRNDALQGIGRTVAHLNQLIGRLNMLRHELEVKAVECDLNQLVTDTLQAHQGDGVEVIKELGSIPKLRIDRDQIQKVLTNLVLNAEQAVGADGKIRVETSHRNGWVVLSVNDNGCGMTSEFIRTSLFRPFQSTKKSGLGIGMFHCKLIVEAHRGQIELESEPGKGTKFRVLLPV